MVRSIKGKDVNLDAFVQAHANTVALGNAKMNARGDILGAGGKVIKTREEIALEYNVNVPNKAVTAPISQPVTSEVKKSNSNVTKK